MDSRDLTKEQATTFRLQIARTLRWHNRLVERLTRLGFPVDDPLWIAAIRARDEMQSLHVAATRAGPVSGVALPLPGHAFTPQ